MIDLEQLRHHKQTLGSADETVRRQAIHSLRTYEEKDWAAVPIDMIRSLVEALHRQLLNATKQTLVRQEILITLGNIGPPSEPAIASLIDLLQEGVPDGIREEAATALGKIGKSARAAVEPLVQMLSHGRTTLAVRVILALSGIGSADHKVRSSLVNLWLAPDQSQNSQVQIALALCKLKIEAKGLLAFLTRTLVAHQDSALRKLAAEALAFCGKTEVDVAPALLTTALHDKDEKVRQSAEAGLAQLHLSHEKAIVLCAKQLKDSSYAEAALRHSGQLAVPALIEAVGADESAVREKALRILGFLGELAAQAVPAVTGALHDKDMDIRLAAAKSLWNITKNADVAVPVLVDLLEEKWPAGQNSAEARRRYLQTVIEALWRIGPPAQLAIPALTHKTKDKNRLISESAINALKVIAPAAASKAGVRY